MNNTEVNWSVFDISPTNDNEDVTKEQIIEEYKKFDGTPREFAKELVKRFGYSGTMSVLVEDWCTDYDNYYKDHE